MVLLRVLIPSPRLRSIAVIPVLAATGLLCSSCRGPSAPRDDNGHGPDFETAELRKLLEPGAVQESQASAPGSQAYARSEGPKLLAAGKWELAAAAYVHWKGLLPEGIAAALQSHAAEHSTDADPYTLRLLEFYFHNMDTSSGSWLGQNQRHVLEFGDSYVRISGRVAEEGHVPALDFSHLDLLRGRIGSLFDESGSVSHEIRKEAIEALASAPDSIPALALYMATLRSPYYDEDTRIAILKEARDLPLGRFGKLAVARAVASDLYGMGSREHAVVRDLLEAAWPLAPDDEDRAQLLLAIARSIHSSSSKRRAAAARVYERFPHTQVAVEARHLAIGTYLDRNEPGPALALLRELQDDPSQRGGLDRALFDTATCYFKQENYDVSLALLTEALELSPGTSLASRTMLGLSETCVAMGDEVNALAWLRKCVGLRTTEATIRGLMDTDNTRSVAIQRLAAHYESKGEWAKALLCWEAWEPQSWCGTCSESMRGKRQAHIRKCRWRLIGLSPLRITGFVISLASAVGSYVCLRRRRRRKMMAS